MLKSSLCDYSNAYILAKGTITVQNTAAADENANNVGEKVIFKKYALFNECISEIHNTHVYNAKDIDVVMPMYNFIDYSNNCSKTSGSLWQYCKDIRVVNNNGDIVDFDEANATDLFSFKGKITSQTGDKGTKDVEIIGTIKILNHFWRTLEMPLISCEINPILTWSANCVIVSTAVTNQGPIFSITDTKY